ncbi:MAG TPA: SxtJ family membrane protein, partial [Longimicrobium sp.]
FAAAFCVVALLPLVHGGGMRRWALGVAAIFLAAALLRPSILHPLNRVWMRIGLLLGMVANPIILAILFYLVLVPIGLLMRLVGSRPLKLGFDPEARSYWTQREPGPPPDTMNRQF